jgi:hypothetical protein
MILWGEIGEFPLVTILQFLAQQRRTGLLEMQDFEEMVSLYLSRGRIEAVASSFWDEMFGARLIAAGGINENIVRESWMTSAESGAPVTAALLERADLERRELVDIVNHHVGDAVMQLMYWNAGTFRFSVPAQPVYFSVVPSLSVEALLLDAYRRVDEGERPSRDKISHEQELCLTCTIECSPEIKGRYLKPDVCLWRAMPSVLKDPIFRGLRKLGRGPRADEDDFGDDLTFI